MDNKVLRAIELAGRAHAGQVDLVGKPYILHCLRVAVDLALAGEPEDTVVVGILHDVVEDTDVTVDRVGDLFGPTVAEAIDLLTHRNGDSYEDYVDRIAWSGNPLAVAVKLADLRSNLSTAPRVVPRKVARYEAAIERLGGVRTSLAREGKHAGR